MASTIASIRNDSNDRHCSRSAGHLEYHYCFRIHSNAPLKKQRLGHCGKHYVDGQLRNSLLYPRFPVWHLVSDHTFSGRRIAKIRNGKAKINPQFKFPYRVSLPNHRRHIILSTKLAVRQKHRLRLTFELQANITQEVHVVSTAIDLRNRG